MPVGYAVVGWLNCLLLAHIMTYVWTKVNSYKNT